MIDGEKIKASDEDALAAYFMASLANANSSIIMGIEYDCTPAELYNAMVGLATAHVLSGARILMMIGVSAEDVCDTITSISTGPLVELLGEAGIRHDG